MALVLRIENETTLPDGGPIEFRITGRRGIDIGRDPYLDWTLPDPSRFISSKHCEIRWTDGGYVLNDVSTNGTFVNGNDRRLDGPYRLKNGDRIMIGNYIVAVENDEDRPAAAAPRPRHAAPMGSDDLWGADAAAPPIDRSELAQRREPVDRPDFLEVAFDLPSDDPFPAHTPDPRENRWGALGSGRADAWKSAPTPGHDVAPAAPRPERVDDPLAGGIGAESLGVETAPIWVDTGPRDVWAPTTPPTPRPPPPSPATTAEPARPQPVPPAPAAAAKQPTPEAVPPAVPANGAATVDLLAELARGAGVPYDVFARRDPAEVMHDVGEMMRIVVEHLMRLLAARTETKRVMRSTQHTMVGPTDNNPLKFSPTSDEAIRLLLGPPLRSYLDGKSALAEGFDDLANHQVRTFAAIQQALKILIEDLDPETIERETGSETGIAALMTGRKARFWDHFSAKWKAKTAHNEDGMIGQFMLYFADCYDRLGSRKKRP